MRAVCGMRMHHGHSNACMGGEFKHIAGRSYYEYSTQSPHPPTPKPPHLPPPSHIMTRIHMGGLVADAVRLLRHLGILGMTLAAQVRAHFCPMSCVLCPVSCV